MIDELLNLIREAERYLPALKRLESNGELGIGLATTNGLRHAIDNARDALQHQSEAVAWGMPATNPNAIHGGIVSYNGVPCVRWERSDYFTIPLFKHRQRKECIEDSIRIDWLSRAGDTSLSLVIDREHDGKFEVNHDLPGDNGYGDTLREAIDDARMKTIRKGVYCE